MANDSWKALAEEMSECKYLSLRWIREPEENRLHMLVEEARVQTEMPVYRPDLLPEVQELMRGSHPILSDSTCRLFRITYEHYISYTVTNESYGSMPVEPEVWTGKLFREYQWSHLLEWVKKTSHASDAYPGPRALQHHEIICLAHVVDVITTEPPVIKLIDRDDFSMSEWAN